MKKSKQSKYTLSSLLVMLFMITLVGCYEPIEGCVEYWATNYNVLADNLCEDCCTAPEVSVDLVYIINDSTQYTFGDTILLASGTYVTLHSANVMLSHFDLYNEGMLVPVTNDSIEIDEVDYEDDFGFSKVQGSLIGLTEYTDPFDVNKIEFLQGLHPVWQDTSIFGLDNVILAEAIDSLYQVSTDKFARFSCTISIDTVDIDTFHAVSSLLDTVSYQKDFNPIALNLGENTTIQLQVNVLEWFNGINLDPGNPTAIADELTSTLADIIVIEVDD